MKLFFTCIISILVCKSLKGKTCRQYSNNTYVSKRTKKAFSFPELQSQTCKALIRSKFHEIHWINHIAYMGANILRGADIPRVFAHLEERIGTQHRRFDAEIDSVTSFHIKHNPNPVWVCIATQAFRYNVNVALLFRLWIRVNA